MWGKWLSGLPALLQHFYVIALVLISWAIFALEDLTQLGSYLQAMAALNGAPLLNGQTLYYLRNYLPVLIIAAFGSTPLAKCLWERISGNSIRLLILIAGIILCTAYVVASTYNPFLYFRF